VIWTDRENGFLLEGETKRNISMIQHAITINFTDGETSEQACVIVRYDETTVLLAVSLQSDGDLEVRIPKADAMALLEGIAKAISSNDG
jgi:hypothetical protein